MPIAAGLIPLKSQIENAFKLQRAASEDLVATLISSAIASVAPMGLFPMGVTMVPLIPSGMTAGKSQIATAFKMQRAAKEALVALQMASGISVICPMVPPAGLIALKSQIENAFKMQRAANEGLVAQQIAQGIITYYQSGGVI